MKYKSCDSSNNSMNFINQEGKSIYSRDQKSTFDMCTPRLLCIPEHCMHIKIPKFTLAHLGPLKRKEAIISTMIRMNVIINPVTESITI